MITKKADAHDKPVTKKVNSNKCQRFLEVISPNPRVKVEDLISNDMFTFLSTTPYKKTVFYIPNESTSPQFYGVDILQVSVDIYGNVRLLVTWSHMEAGVSRSPFFVNYHEVC